MSEHHAKGRLSLAEQSVAAMKARLVEIERARLADAERLRAIEEVVLSMGEELDALRAKPQPDDTEGAPR